MWSIPIKYRRLWRHWSEIIWRILNNNPVMNYFRCSCLINLNRIWSRINLESSNGSFFKFNSHHPFLSNSAPSFNLESLEFREIFDFKEKFPNFEKIWWFQGKKLEKSNVEKWVFKFIGRTTYDCNNFNKRDQIWLQSWSK